MKSTKIPWPKKLCPNQIAVIELATNTKGRKQWRSAPSEWNYYEPGSEHDAHGVCTVLQQHAPAGHLYRIAIYQRIS